MNRDLLTLYQIIESSRMISTYVAGRELKDFTASVQIQDAVARRITIIGEAVKRLTPELKAAHPEADWLWAARQRDFLMHVYDRVDLRRLWSAATVDVVKLLPHVERILTDLDPDWSLKSAKRTP